MIFKNGATSQSVDVQIVDDTGLPVTGLVYSSFPPLTYSLAGANADVSITLAPLAALTTAYSSGGVKERGNGFYRLDLPDACFTTSGHVTVRGEASGQHLICPRIDVVAYDPFDAQTWGGFKKFFNIASPNSTMDSMTSINTVLEVAGFQPNVLTLVACDPTLKELMGAGWMATSATTTPATNGNWYRAAIYNGAPAWECDTAGAYAWFDTSSGHTRWVLTVGTPGTLGSNYFATADGAPITGPYTGVGTTSGTPVVTLNVNDLSGGGGGPSAAAIATAILTDTTSSDFTTANSPGYWLKNGVPANLVAILGTALTETAGYLAAGFRKFFNIASPTSTMNEITLVDTATTLTNAPAANATETGIKSVTDKFLFDGSDFVKSDPQTSLTLAAGAIGIPQLSADLMQTLTRRATFTGTTSPITADTYQLYGWYNDTVYYKSTTLGTPIYIWFDGTHWIISAVLGTDGASYFQSAAVNGTWVAEGSASGTPIAVCHGSACLSAFQPDLASTASAIALAVWNLATTSLTTIGSIGAYLYNFINSIGSSILVTITSPVVYNPDSGLGLNLVVGDDYYASDLRPIDFTMSGTALPDLTSCTADIVCVVDGIAPVVITGGVATVPTGATRTVRFQPHADQTAVLGPAIYGPVFGSFYVRLITAGGHTITPQDTVGRLTIIPGRSGIEVTANP